MSARSVVARFYVYRATMSQGFVVPVITQYQLHRGLSYPEIGALGALFMATWVASEIPTGYAGDRLGRRRSLVVSSVLTAGVVGAYAFAATFPVFAGLYVLWAVGVTFRSGTASAWLYELLEDRLDGEAYARVDGRGRAVWLATSAVTALAGAWLATLDWQYPFLANAALVACSVAALYSLPPTAVADGDRLQFAEVAGVVRRALGRPAVGSFVLYTGLVFAVVEVAATFTQPASRAVGVPLVGLGVLYAGFEAVSAGASAASGRLKRTVGVTRSFLAVPAVFGACFAAVAAAPVAIVPTFLVLRAVNRATQPLKGQFLNDRVEDVGRSTVLSVASMVGALLAAVTRLTGGLLAAAVGPVWVLVALGGAGTALLAALAVASPWPRSGE